MEKTAKKDSFKSRTGFILACIGSAVGMGNLWRFPMLVSTYGGLTFIIPYLIFVAFIGSTGIIEEFALGRAAGMGPVGAFGMCTNARTGKALPGKVIGAVPVIGSMGLSIGYLVVFAWITKYFVMACTGELYKLGTDMELIGGTFGTTASAMGANLWIVIAAVFTFLIMSLGIAGGVEKANKVMMPVLFGLLVVLGIYIAFLPGAADGYKYIFTFNGSGLADPKVWVYAFGQAFFSLSVAGNGSVIYGSYLSKEEDIPYSARMVAIFDTLAALLASLVIIPAMATSGATLESGGPGLIFIYLVNVINAMPGGRLVSIVFFTAVLFAGLSSIINLFECFTALLFEQFKLGRKLSTLISVGTGCIAAICIQSITSEWMDVVSIYICPLGALLAGIMFFHVADKSFALDSVNLGAEKPVGKYFYPLGKYAYCSAAFLALVLGALWGGIG